jgi:hypothetical protein
MLSFSFFSSLSRRCLLSPMFVLKYRTRCYPCKDCMSSFFVIFHCTDSCANLGQIIQSLRLSVSTPGLCPAAVEVLCARLREALMVSLTRGALFLSRTASRLPLSYTLCAASVVAVRCRDSRARLGNSRPLWWETRHCAHIRISGAVEDRSGSRKLWCLNFSILSSSSGSAASSPSLRFLYTVSLVGGVYRRVCEHTLREGSVHVARRLPEALSFPPYKALSSGQRSVRCLRKGLRSSCPDIVVLPPALIAGAPLRRQYCSLKGRRAVAVDSSVGVRCCLCLARGATMAARAMADGKVSRLTRSSGRCLFLLLSRSLMLGIGLRLVSKASVAAAKDP